METVRNQKLSTPNVFYKSDYHRARELPLPKAIFVLLAVATKADCCNGLSHEDRLILVSRFLETYFWVFFGYALPSLPRGLAFWRRCLFLIGFSYFFSYASRAIGESVLEV